MTYESEFERGFNKARKENGEAETGRTENDALIDAVTAAEMSKQPIPVHTDEEHNQFWFLVNGQQVHIDADTHDDYAMHPRRARGRIVVDKLADVVDLAAQHAAEPGAVAAYASAQHHKITVILNDTVGTVPGHRDHTLTHELKETQAWKTWKAMSGNYYEQVAFAEHIEARLIDIVDPTGADMLELVQTFIATSSAEIRSHRRLANGETQIMYAETLNAQAGQSGEFDIPAQIRIRVPMFEGHEPIEVDARFRYRVKEGNLKLGFLLNYADELEAKAFDEAVATLTEAAPFPVYAALAPLS